MKNVFIDNDGDAIDLNSVAAIFRLVEEEDRLLLPMKYNSGDDVSLIFLFTDYPASSKEVLFNKINKIRTDIIKKWNNDTDPIVFFNKIDLTKKNDNVEESSTAE